MINPITIMISNRISNIGFLCACLVVFIHSLPHGISSGCWEWWFCEIFTRGICGMAVPMFFCVSGYLLAGRMDEQGWWSRALRVRVKTLIVPMLFWTVVYFIIITAEQVIGSKLLGTGGAPAFTWHSAAQIPGLILWEHPYVVPFWFFRTLLLFIVISPILRFCVFQSRRWGVVLIVVLAILSCFQHAYFINVNTISENILYVNVYLLNGLSLMCFTIGLFLRKYPVSFGNSRLGLVILIFTFGALVLMRYFGVVIPLVTMGLMMAVWMIVPGGSRINWLTRNAFPVFLLHGLILHCIFSVARHVPEGGVAKTTGGGLIVGVVAIALSVAVAEIVRRSKFANFVFGCR